MNTINGRRIRVFSSWVGLPWMEPQETKRFPFRPPSLRRGKRRRSTDCHWKPGFDYRPQMDFRLSAFSLRRNA